MALHPRIVGRSETDPNTTPTCINCHQPFKGGRKGDPGVNVYSRDGMREVAISGMCETCFDFLFEDMEDDEDDSPTDGGPF